MLFKEKITIEREIYVAPCLQCGSTNIHIFDYGYNAPNMGGGECLDCKHSSTLSVSTNPKIDELINVWNGYNDVQTLIDKEHHKIEIAQSKIADLMMKLPKA